MAFAANALKHVNQTKRSAGATADAAAAAQAKPAQVLLPLLSEPVVQGVLPNSEFQQLRNVLGRLARAGDEAAGGAIGAIPNSHQHAGGCSAHQPQQQLQQQVVAEYLPERLMISSGTPDAVAPAGPDMSLGALLYRLGLAPLGTNVSSCLHHLVQWREQAGAHFPGMHLNDVPAHIVVINHFCAVEEGARQVLALADASLGALLAVQQVVDGLLQLMGRRPLSMLFT